MSSEGDHDFLNSGGEFFGQIDARLRCRNLFVEVENMRMLTDQDRDERNQAAIKSGKRPDPIEEYRDERTLAVREAKAIVGIYKAVRETVFGEKLDVEELKRIFKHFLPSDIEEADAEFAAKFLLKPAELKDEK